MMVAQLTFNQTVVLELLKAVFTAIFVAGAAALIVARYRSKVESAQKTLEAGRTESLKNLEADRAEALKKLELERGERAQALERSLALERAKRDVRTELILKASELGSGFYVQTQGYFRCKDEPNVWGSPDDAEFDKSYGQWSAQSAMLESELRFRYGNDSRPVLLWHQVRDLLTVRYFHLRNRATKKLLAINSINYKNGFHSGLTIDQLANPNTVLNTYHEAMLELTNSLGSAEIEV